MSDDAAPVGDEEARRTALALVSARADGATVCPSEVARALARRQGTPDAWRDFMPTVHAAADRLLAERAVQLSWSGRMLDRRAGPYRIGRPDTPSLS